MTPAEKTSISFHQKIKIATSKLNNALQAVIEEVDSDEKWRDPTFMDWVKVLLYIVSEVTILYLDLLSTSLTTIFAIWWLYDKYVSILASGIIVQMNMITLFFN